MRLSANVSFLFTEVPILDRFASATASGFDAVEFMWPGDSDRDQLCAAIAEAGVNVALFNLSEKDMRAGDRGLLGDPSRRDELEQAVDEALDLAGRTGCKRIHALLGNRIVSLSYSDQLVAACDQVRLIADRAAAQGIQILVEPLNEYDNPGYLCPRIEVAAAFVEKVQRANVRLQFDTYHVACMGDDITEALRRYWPYIGHVQIGDYPGRVEPGKGRIPFERFFGALASLRYQGYVGAEYHPSASTANSFGWRKLNHVSDSLNDRLPSAPNSA